MSTSTPQSPDLARSGRSAADPKSAKAHADVPPVETGPEGPVPADSAPGHHPDVEQDRPTGPPPLPRRAASKAAVRAGAKKAAAKKAAAKKAAGKEAAGKTTAGPKAVAKKTAGKKAGGNADLTTSKNAGPKPTAKKTAAATTTSPKSTATNAGPKAAAKKVSPTKAAAGKAKAGAGQAGAGQAGAGTTPRAMRTAVPVTGGPAAELSGAAVPGIERPTPPSKATATVDVAGGPAADLVEAPGSMAPETVAPVTRLRARDGRRPAATVRFPFAVDRRVLPFSLLFGVVPMTSGVELDAEHLRIRFGMWKLTTSLDNIADVRVTGPYQLLRVAGPPRLSLADGGITFATGTGPGVCIAFREPVPAALPVALLRHRSATVTVLEPESFAETLSRRTTA